MTVINNNPMPHKAETEKMVTKKNDLIVKKSDSVDNNLEKADFFDLYWKHYQYYLDNENPSLDDLYKACQYLSLSACSGYVGAKSSLRSSPNNLLSCHLPRIIADELKARLETISPQSSLYDQTRILLFFHYYSRRDYTYYNNYEERFADIYYGFKHLCSRKNARKNQNNDFFEHFFQNILIGYPNDVTEENIIESTWRALTIELAGGNVFSLALSSLSAANNDRPEMFSHYPFPILSDNEMQEVSKSIHLPMMTNDFLQNYQMYKTNIIDMVDCSAELNQSYVFNIPADWLENPSKPILCFRDKKTHKEIARFEFSQGKLVFKAYGKAIHIAVKGDLTIPTCVFENPGSTVTLAADFKSENPVSLAADMDYFTLRGNIQTSQKITLESSGRIELPKKSIIESTDSDIFIKAKSLQLRGRIHSAQRNECLIQEDISMAPQSECYANKSMKVSAGILREIRGKLFSDGPMEVNANDIYLHGSGEISARALTLKANIMAATDKSKVIVREILKIEKMDKLVINKESMWSALDFSINAKEFTNHSPNLSAINARIHCDEHFVQYPEGKITTKNELKFTGGSVWNAGKLHYGHDLKVKVNNCCVLGLTELSSFSRVKEAFSCAELKGDNAEITAGVFFNFVGGIEVKNLSVSSILKIDIGATRLKTSQNSCIAELDCGVTIPNIQAYYDDIKSFFNLMDKKEYGAALKLIFNYQNGISLASALRSILRTIVPGAGKSADFAWSIFMAICSSKKLCSQVVALHQTRKEKPLELSDIIQLVASSSNVVSQSVNIGTQFQAISLDDLSLASASLPSYKIPSLALSSLSAFSPGNLDDSVIGLGLGNIQTGGSVTHRSLLSYEQGCAQIGFNVSNSFYINEQDNTLTVANVASNTGHQLNHSGSTLALGVFNNVDEQKESASTISIDAAWHSRNLQLAGETDAIDMQAVANIVIDDSHITAKNHASLIGKDHLERTEKADLTAKQITVSSDGQTINAGNIHSTPPAPAFVAPKLTSITEDASEDKTDASGAPKASEEKSPILAPSVVIHGEDVLLTETSNIDAAGQTVLIDSSNITDNGACNAASYIDNAKLCLDIGKDAHHNTSDILSYKGKTTTLKGDSHTDKLYLTIDNLSDQQMDLLLNHAGEYEHYRPTSLLSIKTENNIALTHDYNLGFSLDLNGKNIVINGNIHSTNDLFFSAIGEISNYQNIRADGSLIFNSDTFKNIHGDLSSKVLYVHAHGNILNLAGNFQADTHLRIASDIGSFFNQGELRDAWKNGNLVKIYNSAHLTGGNGNGYGQQGLYIKTESQFWNEGSSVTCPTNTYLDTREGTNNLAADYTSTEYVDLPELIDESFEHKLSHLTESQTTIIVRTNNGNETILAGQRSTGEHSTALVINQNHGGTSIAIERPLETVATTVAHTVSSEITTGGTLAVQIEQGDLNNNHSLISGETVLANLPHGNLNNVAAVMQGRTFLGVHANDINNVALAHDIPGKLGGRDKEYEAGTLLGGTGQGHEGIGMALQADGVIRLLGSIISSEGDNVLLGKHGIDSRAMHNTYISYHRETSNWCGRDTETTEYSERIQPAVIFSANGSNYMVSSEGNIYSVSTEFLAARDNVFIGKHNIDLLGLISTTRVEKDVSTLFGINDHQTTETNETAIPNVVVNPENAKFESLEGNVRLLNAAVIGQNKVEINTPNGSTEVSAPIVNHTLIDKSRGLGINSPAVSNGFNVFPVYQDAHALSRANNTTEYAAGAWNAAIDTMNAISNTMAGSKNNSAKQSLFSASYLTGIELSYTYSKTTQTFQTVANNVGINCGTLVINAGNKIVFSNGVNVTVLHLADLTAKEFWQLGAKLENTFEKDTATATLGTSLVGDINVGAGINHADAQGTTYANQTFTVGGTANIHVQQWNMRNANTNVNNLKAVTDLLSIVSDTNKSEGQSWGEQVNTNGDISLQNGTNQSEVIDIPSGIQANVINVKSHETALEGAVINASNGSFQTDTLESKSVDQYSKSNSIGASLNTNSFKKPSGESYQPPISTVNLANSNKDYEVTQMSTVCIQQGLGLQAKEIIGLVNTSNPSGLNVNKDEQSEYMLKMPLGYSGSGFPQQKIDNSNDEASPDSTLLPYQTSLEEKHFSTAINGHDEKHKTTSPLEQDAINQKALEDQQEISEVKLSTDINTNDKKYSTYLTEIASDIKEIKPEKVDYVTPPSTVAYYAPMISGEKPGDQASSALNDNSFFKYTGNRSNERKLDSSDGYFNDLTYTLSDVYFSTENWSKASIDILSETTKDIGLEYKEIGNYRLAIGKKVFNMLGGDFIEGEVGVDRGLTISRLENKIGAEFLDYGSKLELYSKFATRGINIIEAGEVISKVKEATPDQRLSVAYVNGWELYGKIKGAEIGCGLVAGLTLFGRVPAIITGPPIVIATSAAGGYIAKSLAEGSLQLADDLNKSMKMIKGK